MSISSSHSGSGADSRSLSPLAHSTSQQNLDEYWKALEKQAADLLRDDPSRAGDERAALPGAADLEDGARAARESTSPRPQQQGGVVFLTQPAHRTSQDSPTGAEFDFITDLDAILAEDLNSPGMRLNLCGKPFIINDFLRFELHAELDPQRMQKLKEALNLIALALLTSVDQLILELSGDFKTNRLFGMAWALILSKEITKGEVPTVELNDVAYLQSLITLSHATQFLIQAQSLTSNNKTPFHLAQEIHGLLSDADKLDHLFTTAVLRKYADTIAKAGPYVDAASGKSSAEEPSPPSADTIAKAGPYVDAASGKSSAEEPSPPSPVANLPNQLLNFFKEPFNSAYWSFHRTIIERTENIRDIDVAFTTLATAVRDSQPMLNAILLYVVPQNDKKPRPVLAVRQSDGSYEIWIPKPEFPFLSTPLIIHVLGALQPAINKAFETECRIEEYFLCFHQPRTIRDYLPDPIQWIGSLFSTSYNFLAWLCTPLTAIIDYISYVRGTISTNAIDLELFKNAVLPSLIESFSNVKLLPQFQAELEEAYLRLSQAQRLQSLKRVTFPENLDLPAHKDVLDLFSSSAYKELTTTGSTLHALLTKIQNADFSQPEAPKSSTVEERIETVEKSIKTLEAYEKEIDDWTLNYNPLNQVHTLLFRVFFEPIKISQLQGKHLFADLLLARKAYVKLCEFADQEKLRNISGIVRGSGPQPTDAKNKLDRIFQLVKENVTCLCNFANKCVPLLNSQNGHRSILNDGDLCSIKGLLYMAVDNGSGGGILPPLSNLIEDARKIRDARVSLDEELMALAKTLNRFVGIVAQQLERVYPTIQPTDNKWVQEEKLKTQELSNYIPRRYAALFNEADRIEKIKEALTPLIKPLKELQQGSLDSTHQAKRHITALRTNAENLLTRDFKACAFQERLKLKKDTLIALKILHAIHPLIDEKDLTLEQCVDLFTPNFTTWKGENFDRLDFLIPHLYHLQSMAGTPLNKPVPFQKVLETMCSGALPLTSLSGDRTIGKKGHIGYWTNFRSTFNAVLLRLKYTTQNVGELIGLLTEHMTKNATFGETLCLVRHLQDSLDTYQNLSLSEIIGRLNNDLSTSNYIGRSTHLEVLFTLRHWLSLAQHSPSYQKQISDLRAQPLKLESHEVLQTKCTRTFIEYRKTEAGKAFRSDLQPTATWENESRLTGEVKDILDIGFKDFLPGNPLVLNGVFPHQRVRNLIEKGGIGLITFDHPYGDIPNMNDIKERKGMILLAKKGEVALISTELKIVLNLYGNKREEAVMQFLDTHHPGATHFIVTHFSWHRQEPNDALTEAFKAFDCQEIMNPPLPKKT